MRCRITVSVGSAANPDKMDIIYAKVVDVKNAPIEELVKPAERLAKKLGRIHEDHSKGDKAGG